MSDEKHQEIDYDSSNGCVRSFNRTFCLWGQRKTPYDKEGNIKGKTAPLWANPAKKFFMWMFIISLIMCILFIAAYIIVNYYNNTIKDNEKDDKQCVRDTKKKFKIVFVIFGFLYLFLYCKNYASDQEWSRYMIILLFFWLCMVGFNVASYIVTASNLRYFNKNKKEIFKANKKCKTLFRTNLGLNFCVCIINSIIEALILFKIFMIAKDFFFSKYVEHSASCEDEDIIIME